MKIEINHTAPQSRAVPARDFPPQAFTLIELMISIALVVILILGVSQVFQYTTQAVGSGEAVTAAIRNSRSAQSAFASDFSSLVGAGSGSNDAPFLLIGSRARYAFNNSKDEHSQGQLATLPTSGGNYLTNLPNAALQDIDGNGISGELSVNGEIIHPDNYNFRNHRLDVVSFFGRNQFARQTGNPGIFVASQAANEALIWYGHLWLPDNKGNFTAPITFPCESGSSSNPNNYYGNQLVLGRQQILMQQHDSNGNVDDRTGTAQWYIPVNTATNGYPPLYQGSKIVTTTTETNDAGPYYYADSRIDLLNYSLSGFSTAFNAYLTNYPSWAWWDSMMDGNQYATAQVVGGTTEFPRFKCIPALNKPMTAANMAQASPYFLGGCSQFIVEFAGDFLTQDNDPTHTTRVSGSATANPPTGHAQYGDVLGIAISAKNPTNAKGDSQLDFFINSNHVKQTIWYGLPRNTSGQITTSAGNEPINPISTDPTHTTNPNGDVVPVRDWLQYVYDTSGNLVSVPGSDPGAPFEVSNINIPPISEIADYNQNFSTADAANGYICGWNSNNPPPKIMLIRITMTLEDPTGRLPNGQTFQFVFPVNPSSTSN